MIVVATAMRADAAPGAGASPPTSVFEMPLPGGLRGALDAIGDHLSPDRGQFLAEFIRRTYDTPLESRSDPRAQALHALLARLRASEGRPGPDDTLPLPLSPEVWIEVVFKGRATARTLAREILQSREAALFYCALLSLDDETRTWLAGQRDLIADLSSAYAAPFLLAAPGLRVSAGRLHLPGGAPALPVWNELAGRRVGSLPEFIRALVSSADGHLAILLGEMALLSDPQVRVAFDLESPDTASRIEAGRRLLRAFQRVARGGSPWRGAFGRPVLDPALLIAELEEDAAGLPIVPGSRGLWNAVFSGASPSDASAEWSSPAGFAWLSERVFVDDLAEQHRRYVMVLFASRTGRPNAPQSIPVIRAAAAYPSLVMALERAGVTTQPALAAAAGRAASLAAIPDRQRASTALAQFQGALVLITRATRRGSLGSAHPAELVASLSAVPLNDRGEYEGRLVRWLATWLDATGNADDNSPPGDADEDVFERAPGPIERRVLRALAGPRETGARLLDWEGTRYRLDTARAEGLRMLRALGDDPRPFLTSATRVSDIADALARRPLVSARLAAHAQALATALQAVTPGDTSPSDSPAVKQYEKAAAALRRAADAGDTRSAARLVPLLYSVADDLFARGLMEMAYAAALGPRDGVSIAAAEAARRHDFGLHPGTDGRRPWRPPLSGLDAAGRWRVVGSLLDLDVLLADFSLVRVSTRLPVRRPTLNDSDRRAFIDTVALVEPAALTDEARDTIASAIRRGRARLEQVRTPADALALAAHLRFSAARRTLLAWTAAHDPERVSAFLSESELLRLGLERAPASALRHWGVPAIARRGCLCLQVVDRRPWEAFSGRWDAGMMAGAFPDLNLRLAELLSDAGMPAALLRPVLAAATIDFVDNAISRDPDDRRGLVEAVRALDGERLEAYLALLTTDGPLVPLGPTPDREARQPAHARREVRQR